MYSSYYQSNDASTSGQSSSIADMLREAAQEVLTANIPPGFHFVPEYGVYYSPEAGYYYDEKTNLFYHLETQVYYYYDAEAGQYKVYKSLHPLEWKKRVHRRMAIEMLGAKAIEAMDQADVDACETLFFALDELPETPQEVEDNRRYHEGQKKRRDRERRRRREDEYYERKAREEKGKREIFDGDSFVEVRDRRYRDEHDRRWEEDEGRGRRDDRRRREDDDRSGGRWSDHRRYQSYSDSDEERRHNRYVDERVTMMKEEGYDQAPCVRLIHQDTFDLFIVTVNGGTLGTTNDCDIKVADSTLPPKLAQIVFVEDTVEVKEETKKEEEEGEDRERDTNTKNKRRGRSSSSSSDSSRNDRRDRRRDRSEEEERREKSRMRRKERREEERKRERREERRRRKKGIIDFVDRRQGKYYLRVLSNGAKCTMNGHKVKKEASDVLIEHGTLLSFAKSNSYSLHIHSGRNTCADCEPGLLRATVANAANEGNEGARPRLKGERARREEMRRMKSALGLAMDDDGDEKPSYFDRAKIRRKTVGSDMPSLPKRPKVGGGGMYDACDAKPLPGAVPIVTATDSKATAKKAIGQENKGFKLLKAMGWSEGEGLGKTVKGRVEPVANEVKNNRAGLGSSGGGGGGTTVPIGGTAMDAVWEKTRNRFKEIEQAEKKGTQ